MKLTIEQIGKAFMNGFFNTICLIAFLFFALLALFCAAYSACELIGILYFGRDIFHLASVQLLLACGLALWGIGNNTFDFSEDDEKV